MSTYNTAYQLCPNRNCEFYLSSADNVNIHDSRRNRFICTACGKTWVGHRNEVHYGLRTALPKIKRALDLLEAGWSIRKTAELAKVSPSTILRWKKKQERS